MLPRRPEIRFMFTRADELRIQLRFFFASRLSDKLFSNVKPVLIAISKIALVIIENGARWLVENFVRSRYNYH